MSAGWVAAAGTSRAAAGPGSKVAGMSGKSLLGIWAGEMMEGVGVVGVAGCDAGEDGAVENPSHTGSGMFLQSWAE